MVTTIPDQDGGAGLKVIHVALFRMATRSVAEAYRILGYKVHHGLDVDTLNIPWGKIEEAAEATWPEVPGAKPRPRFTRQDWNELWGNEYDIATDVASPFCDQLIEAYPDAKVVIVQRDFDTWWPSFKSQCVDSLFVFPAPVIMFLLTKIMGVRAGEAMKKIHFGLFTAKNRNEIQVHAREGYDRYFERIRQMVPPEKRLEYNPRDGWEPLCRFLDKDVPDVPFPRKNDRKSHQSGQQNRTRRVFVTSVKILAPWVVGALVLGAALRYARS